MIRRKFSSGGVYCRRILPRGLQNLPPCVLQVSRHVFARGKTLQSSSFWLQAHGTTFPLLNWGLQANNKPSFHSWRGDKLREAVSLSGAEPVKLHKWIDSGSRAELTSP